MDEITKEEMEQISINIRQYIDNNLLDHRVNMKSYADAMKEDVKQALIINSKELNKNRRFDVFVNSVLNGVIVGISIAICMHYLK
jgi:hypothetical protein